MVTGYVATETLGLGNSIPYENLLHQPQGLSPSPAQQLQQQQPSHGLSSLQSVVPLSPAPLVVLRLSEVISKAQAEGGASSDASSSLVSAAAVRMESKLYGAGSSSVAGSTTTGGSTTIPPSVPSETGDAARPAGLGSAEMPSRGSALHQWGACKPCAFVFAEGCMNDINCQFCHLCEPGEKKRRRKERRKIAAGARPRT
jgi:hypothetical protein